MYITSEYDVVVFVYLLYFIELNTVAVSPNFSQAEIWSLIKARSGAITVINGFLGY